MKLAVIFHGEIRNSINKSRANKYQQRARATFITYLRRIAIE